MNSTLEIRASLNEMEVLSWAAMTDDELVERLANEIWRIPPEHYNGQKAHSIFLQVGILPSKIRGFVMKFGHGRNVVEKHRLCERIEDRATALFEEQIAIWVEEVIEDILLRHQNLPVDIRMNTVIRAVEDLTPCGAKERVAGYVFAHFVALRSSK